MKCLPNQQVKHPIGKSDFITVCRGKKRNFNRNTVYALMGLLISHYIQSMPASLLPFRCVPAQTIYPDLCPQRGNGPALNRHIPSTKRTRDSGQDVIRKNGYYRNYRASQQIGRRGYNSRAKVVASIRLNRPVSGDIQPLIFFQYLTLSHTHVYIKTI